MLLVSSPLSLLSVFFFSVSSALIISPTLYLIQCSQMAAFSYQHLPSILDMSVFLPNSSIKMSGSLEEGYINNISTCFPYSSPTEQFHENPAEKQRTDSSSIVVDLDLEGSSDQATQMVSPKRKNTETSCLSSAESKDSKRSKPKKQRNCCGKNKQTEKKKSKDEKKNQKKNPEAPPGGYVHVRARRGEATDSHSLAERVRRERISERLKLLQSLVPGCDKVTSKALMLDEIINYVQSLQHQVEFLSMKLTSLSPMVYDMGGLDMNSICTKPEKLSSLASPLPQAQQTLLNPSSTVAADITAPPFTAAQYYPLLDNSVLSYLPQQQGGQRPNFSYQDIGNLLWEVDEQRQRFLNQSDFTTLCSFQ